MATLSLDEILAFYEQFFQDDLQQEPTPQGSSLPLEMEDFDTLSPWLEYLLVQDFYKALAEVEHALHTLDEVKHVPKHLSW